VTISVGDLVEQPHLRIETLAGAIGLSATVTWAHSSDLAEPWDWLSGGEMLMKNGRTLPRSAQGQVAFLEGLAAARASALVIGADPSTPRITRPMLARADQIGLPLLLVPYSMSFIVLSRAVADATVDAMSRSVARTGRIYATIHAAVAGAAPRVFLDRLEVELGCRLFVLDKATGTPVLAGTRSPDRKLKAAVLDALARRGGAVPGLLRLPDQARRTAVAVEVPYEEPTLLVAERTDGGSFEITMLQHAATATAVEVAHASIRQDYQRQLGSELLARLIDSRLDGPDADARLAEHGVTSSSARLIATRGADSEQQRRLHVGLRRREVPHLVLARGEVLLVLVSGPRSAQDAVEIVTRRLGPRATAGVSDILASSLRLGDALREAMWMLSVAARQSQPVAFYGETAALSILRDPIEAQGLVERVLGPLLAYDRSNNTQLVHSLHVFLENQRSWQRTAVLLEVHRQTVIYRMERVGQLTGRSISETGDLAELWLAISAFDLLQNTATWLDPPTA
jgi:purine catabolism regulator